MANLTKTKYATDASDFKRWYSTVKSQPKNPTWYDNAIDLGIHLPDLSMDDIEAYLLANYPEVFI